MKDLAGPGVKFIAMAQPELAPYGAASAEVLKGAGLWDAVQPKLVYGTSISMAKQLAASGSADAVRLLLNAGAGLQRPLDRRIEMMTSGAPPPAAVIEGMGELGFHITHVYGLTEVYGPAVICAWRDEWDELPAAERARQFVKKSRESAAGKGLDRV